MRVEKMGAGGGKGEGLYAWQWPPGKIFSSSECTSITHKHPMHFSNRKCVCGIKQENFSPPSSPPQPLNPPLQPSPSDLHTTSPLSKIEINVRRRKDTCGEYCFQVLYKSLADVKEVETVQSGHSFCSPRLTPS